MVSKNEFKFLVFLIVLAATLAMIGCGKNADGNTNQNHNQGEEQASETLSGNIQIAGSTSVQPLTEELAMAFMEKNPDVRINVQGGGSSAGVKAAAEGVANIGMASRALRDEEKATVTSTVIAKDGISVVVNPANNVSDLTIDQVKGIFAGKITDWSELGGTSASIVVINREDGSGTRGAFGEMVLGKEEKFTEGAVIQNSTGAIRTAVSSDVNAIGYISMGSINETVKVVKVDGIDASEENVIAGSYKIFRPFNFLTKGEMDGVTKAFIYWILSGEGQELVSEEFIPVQ